MEQATCLTKECGSPALSRGLCNSCYGRAWRTRDFSAALPVTRHVVSEVNREALTGVCLVCGPTNVRWRKTRRYYECSTVTRSNKETVKPHPSSPEHRRRYKLRTQYGISLERYEEMYSAAGGACEICGASFPALCVDHDHETGAVRGLLCTRCNQGLGYFRDDPARMIAGINYLTRGQS